MTCAVVASRSMKVPEPSPTIITTNYQDVTREQLLAFLEGKVVKWWLPDDVTFVDELPHTATGKLLKTALRERFRDYRLPDLRD